MSNITFFLDGCWYQLDIFRTPECCKNANTKNRNVDGIQSFLCNYLLKRSEQDQNTFSEKEICKQLRTKIKILNHLLWLLKDLLEMFHCSNSWLSKALPKECLVFEVYSAATIQQNGSLRALHEISQANKYSHDRLTQGLAVRPLILIA